DHFEWTYLDIGAFVVPIFPKTTQDDAAERCSNSDPKRKENHGPLTFTSVTNARLGVDAVTTQYGVMPTVSQRTPHELQDNERAQIYGTSQLCEWKTAHGVEFAGLWECS
ncbi:hypothetical protein MMC28_009788, partial [Mycoblastus sanguinarius]|nr:hypothetical protein [Mycoblastus sanguinarius]